MRNKIDVEKVQKRYIYDAEAECLRDMESGTEIALHSQREYGYKRIDIDGVTYQLSRIVWAIVKGEDPGDMDIDHDDRNKNDNTIGNLRCVTTSDNNKNRLCTYPAPARCVQGREEPTVSEDDIIMREYLAVTGV